MNNVEKLQRTRSFPTIRVESEPSGDAHWMYMHSDVAPGVRPCFRSQMLDDVLSFMNSITLRESQRQPGKLRHLVVASDASAFNLGGDLELFSQLIRENNRDRLLSYARRCIDGVHHLNTGLGGDVRTIALIQGDALGGGFEALLCFDVVIAERSARFGLPEMLFGLFPGMGAYSILSRKLGGAMADRVIMGEREIANGMLASGKPELRQDLIRSGYDLAPQDTNVASNPKQRWIIILSLLGHRWNQIRYR